MKKMWEYIQDGILLPDLFKRGGNSVLCDINEPWSTLSEISQPQKDKNCNIPLMWCIWNSEDHRYNQTVEWRLPGSRWEGKKGNY